MTPAEEVLTTIHFKPAMDGWFDIEHVGQILHELSDDELENVFEELSGRGYIKEDTPPEVAQRGKVLYRATKSGWVARESLVRDFGWRHPAIMNQNDYSLRDLMLAILQAPLEEWRRSPGPIAPNGYVAGVEFSVYLPRFKHDDIVSTGKRLIGDRLATAERKHFNGVQVDALKTTIAGERAYKMRISLNVIARIAHRDHVVRGT